MKKSLLYLITSLCFIIVSQGVYAESLDDQRIWKLPNDKRSIFLDKGIFHHKVSNQGKRFQIKNLRNSYKSARGYERVVFDFNSDSVPGLYGHISKGKKLIKIDFFNTDTSSQDLRVVNSRFIEGVDFFSFDDDTSVEIKLKDNVVFDVFYLESPGRIVIDIRS